MSDDLTTATATKSVKIAGGMLVLSGGFGVLNVVQIFYTVVFFRDWPQAIPVLMAIASIAALVFGVGFSRARSWAPWPAVGTSTLLWLAGSAWFVFAIVSGFITLYAFIVPIVSFVATICVFFNRSSCTQTAQARARLSMEGIDLGV